MPISSVLINFLIFWGVGWLLRGQLPVKRVLGVIIQAAMVAGLGWILFSASIYIFTPIFFDHAEANIANVAAYWRWGHSIYTDLADPHRYSLLYGPLSYILVAFCQSLGAETILFSKMPGVAACMLSLAATWAIASKVTLSFRTRVLVTASVAVIFCGFYNYSYWIRPDSFLILFAIVGLLVARSAQSSIWPWVAIGILAGLASGAKAHGVIYFLPIAAYAFELSERRNLLLKITLSGVAFLTLFFAPFFLPGISLNSYMRWLGLASQHGLQWGEFFKNFTFIGSFFILLWLVGFARSHKLTFFTFLFSGFLASLAGSKLGAGSNHLLPLLPLMVLFSFESFAKLPGDDVKRRSHILGAFLLSLSLNGFNRQKRIRDLVSERPMRSAEFRDLKELVGKYDGSVEMGYSSMDSYLSASYKPWLVSKTGVLLFDGASLMDLGASGVKIPETSVALLSSCSIKRIIMPIEGDPWSMASFYEGQEIFPETLRKAFVERYKIIESTQYFRIYECD